MKKLILFASGMLLLAACSKKSDPKPATDPNAKFVGSWSATVDSTFTTTDGTTRSSAITYNNDYIWKFNADGSGQVLDGSDTPLPTTWSASNGKLSVQVATSGSGVQEVINFTVLSVTSDKMALTVSVDGGKEDIYFVKQ
jgi:hypothetical protein